MKIKGIEVEEGPFSDAYLDECMEKTDVDVDIHLAPDSNKIKAIVEGFEAIEDEGVGKVVYIHDYPEDLVIKFGIKTKEKEVKS